MACGGTERIATILFTTHLTSLGYLWLEPFYRLRMWFLNATLPGWYSVDFGVATANGTDTIAYLNASVSF